jgi:hypothetical protein
VETPLELNSGYPTQHRREKRTFHPDNSSQTRPDNSKRICLGLAQEEGSPPPLLCSPSSCLTALCTSTNSTLYLPPSSPTSSSARVRPPLSPHLLNPSFQHALPSSITPRTTGDYPPIGPVGRCKEKRGIFKRWASDTDVATQTSAYPDTIRLLANLATVSVNILSNNLDTPGLGVGRPSSILSSTSVQPLEGNSLGAIASRIRNQEKKGVDLDFQSAISIIQFGLKLDILQEAKKKDFTTLIREEIQSGGELDGCTERQGKRWRAWGSRLAEFAGAGKSSVFNMNK